MKMYEMVELRQGFNGMMQPFVLERLCYSELNIICLIFSPSLDSLVVSKSDYRISDPVPRTPPREKKIIKKQNKAQLLCSGSLDEID